MKRLIVLCLVSGLLIFTQAACTNTQKGTAAGTAVGAAAGIGIAAISGGYIGWGALAGAGVGALAGGIIGQHKDTYEDEQRVREEYRRKSHRTAEDEDI